MWADILVALMSGLGGAVLGVLAAVLLPTRMRLEHPVEVALRRDFVPRDEYAADIRRLHDKIEADQRNISTKLEGIGTTLGRLEGKVDMLQCNTSRGGAGCGS